MFQQETQVTKHLLAFKTDYAYIKHHKILDINRAL